ncbi:MAG: SDR family oxidoreductase [Rhodospirillaceae bacterium]|nr:SDR family oxidoreductase [Rhodospirillaceae bacterium]
MQRRAWLAVVAAVVLCGFGPAAAQSEGKKPVVLLAGATGKNGSQVLKALKALPGEPFEVRAMTRDSAAAASKFGSDFATWYEADVLKPETLAKVMDGVDFIIDAKAATGVLGDNRPEMVDYEGTKNMLAAAKAAGTVKKYVIITSSVSGQKDHFLNKVGRNVLIYKGMAEEALMASGIPYVIVGPAGMTDEPPGKAIKLIPRAEYAAGMKISRIDTAAVCIAALTDPAADNRAFTVINGDGAYAEGWQEAFARMPAK